MQQLRHWARAFAHPRDLISTVRQPGICYVLQPSNWVLGHIADYLVRELQPLSAVPVRRVAFPWLSRGQVLHFGDRYQLLHGPHHRLHRDNRLVVTWFHGDADDSNSGMRAAVAALPAVLPRIERVVTSCTISRDALVRLGVPIERIAVIPLGVDPELFRPAEPEARRAFRQSLGFAEDLPVLGSFQKDGTGWGDGDEPKLVKGPDVFLTVCERLKAAGHTFGVLLTGPSRGYVKAGLERLGILYRHRLLGDFREIVQYYQALDAYLIASRAEGGPMALAECWATGVPVVSTRVGMPADRITPGRDGLLADSEDAEALAAAVAELLADPARRAALATAGRESARELAWSGIARRHLDEVYAPLLASAPPTADGDGP